MCRPLSAPERWRSRCKEGGRVRKGLYHLWGMRGGIHLLLLTHTTDSSLNIFKILFYPRRINRTSFFFPTHLWGCRVLLSGWSPRCTDPPTETSNFHSSRTTQLFQCWLLRTIENVSGQAFWSRGQAKRKEKKNPPAFSVSTADCKRAAQVTNRCTAELTASPNSPPARPHTIIIITTLNRPVKSALYPTVSRSTAKTSTPAPSDGSPRTPAAFLPSQTK